MTTKTPASKDLLAMKELCIQRKSFMDQTEQATIAEIRARINIENLTALMIRVQGQISDLKTKGIKEFVVKDDEILNTEKVIKHDGVN